MNTKRRESEPGVNGLYYGAFLPIISGLFMATLPEWSSRIGLFVLIILIMNSLLTIFMKMTRYAEKSRKRKVIYAIIQFHLFVFFLLGVVWRYWDGGLLLALTLLLLNLVTAYIGHRYREILFQELMHPRTKVGKVIYGVGIIGGGIAGLLGYALSRFFSDRFPFMTPYYVTIAFVVVSVYILLIMYAGWIKVEKPDWEPDIRPVRAGNKKRIR